jgi:hypothetical protein
MSRQILVVDDQRSSTRPLHSAPDQRRREAPGFSRGSSLSAFGDAFLGMPALAARFGYPSVKAGRAS